MKKTLIIAGILLSFSLITTASQPVVRMLFFNLKYEVDSPEARTFLEGTDVLRDIPAVVEFDVLKVRSNKFNYDYAIRIVFKDEDGVDQYVKHPIHNDYVENEWKPNVTEGLLIDLLDPGL